MDIGILTETESSEKGRRFHLTGICTGGPYTLTLTVGEQTFVFTEIYVGDVWILGGQSNMDGCGFYTVDALWSELEDLYQLTRIARSILLIHKYNEYY